MVRRALLNGASESALPLAGTAGSEERRGGRPPRRRAGFSLIEVLFGALLLGIATVSLMHLLAAGTQGTARAGASEMASMVAVRAMDRLVAGGYRSLATLGGVPQPLTVDGLTFVGTFKVDEIEQGLLRVRVSVVWKRRERPGPTAVGTFDLVRYVADPCLCLSTRAGAGGADA